MDQNNIENNENSNQSDENLSENSTTLSENNEISENNLNNPQPSTSYAERIHNQNLEEFREELRVKREARVNALQALKNEIQDLKSELQIEKAKNRNCKCDKVVVKNEKVEVSDMHYELQLANAEILSLTTELDCTRKQVRSLKEVINVSKKMIEIREEQVSQLKSKIKDIENSLGERELKIMSEDLRKEYNRQLENIRSLKLLYEERARVAAIERDKLKKDLDDCMAELNSEKEKSKSLNEDLEKTTNELNETKKQLYSSNLQSNKFQAELSTINELSKQILTGFNNSKNNLDLDKLKEVLEENRELLMDINKMEDSFEGASVLPKMLFDLIVQANKFNDQQGDNLDSDDEMNEIKEMEINSKKLSTSDEIAMNLPKVWRILTEFINHQSVKHVKCTNTDEEDINCFKTNQTAKGPELVLSVSKTFIKLRDLILEKKSLQKETTRLRTLNGHLDKRLQSQEKRLSVVSLELTKTWHLVGKMQRQHRQLHTSEQILRYQLKQKRRMLNELKEELEYCRKKWAQAREKNNDSEDQWRILKKEFQNRKLYDGNNSAESGYDEQNTSSSSDDDEDDVKSDNEENNNDSLKNCRSNSFTQINEIHLNDSLDFRRGNSEPTEIYETTEEVLDTNEHETHIVLCETENENVEDVVITTTTPVEPQPGPSKEVEIKKIEVQHREETLEEMFNRLNSIFDDNNEKTVEENQVQNKELEIPEPTNITDCDVIESEIVEDSLIEIKETPSTSSEIINELPQSTVSDLGGTNSENLPKSPEKIEEKSCLTQREIEYTTRRDERLKRLEEQCRSLVRKATNTASKSGEMSNQLDSIHKKYCITTTTTTSTTENPTTSESQENKENITDTKSEKIEHDAFNVIENIPKPPPIPPPVQPQSTAGSKPFLHLIEQKCIERRFQHLRNLEKRCSEFSTKIKTIVNKYEDITDGVHGETSSNPPVETTTNQEILTEPVETEETGNIESNDGYQNRRTVHLQNLEQQCLGLILDIEHSVDENNDEENEHSNNNTNPDEDENSNN